MVTEARCAASGLRPLVLLATLLVGSGGIAQEWLRYRGEGDLLPPQLGGGAALADLTWWDYAWEFQRDLLTPEVAGKGMPAATVAAVVGALQANVAAADDEVALLSLWSLARVGGRSDAAAKALRVIVRDGALRLSESLREVGVLGLGLAAHGDMATVVTLRDVAQDRDAGRKVFGIAEVPERLRCYALYGLGLAAAGDEGGQLPFHVFATVERLLLPDSTAPPQVRIAALHALMQVRLDAAPKLSGPALALLEHQWNLVEPAGFLSVRAQAALAVARMIGPDHAAAADWRRRFVETLERRDAPRAVSRSCAQALGQLTPSTDEETCAKLQEFAGSGEGAHKDNQTRFLALFALGLVGGEQNVAWLLETAKKVQPMSMYTSPWIAFGLARGYRMRDEQAPREVVDALAGLARRTRHPHAAPGVALACGLVAREECEELIASLLGGMAAAGGPGASICAALPRAPAGATRGQLLALLDSSARRAAAEASFAVASFEAATLRARLLDAERAASGRYAAAAALRGDGDGPTVAELVARLTAAATSVEERRVCAMALGCLCDDAARHWSAGLAAAIDYRSATPVLVGLPHGVLRLP